MIPDFQVAMLLGELFNRFALGLRDGILQVVLEVPDALSEVQDGIENALVGKREFAA
jgi:hypothetical protein